jgi:flagellar biosynthesis/type III secretory pathway protein FliH
MKIKTWRDTRTFEEKTGLTKAEIEAALAGTQPGIERLTHERHAEIENRKKPEPEHHHFDIELLPPYTIEESEEGLVVRLFFLYGRFKSYLERFSLSDFCEHHEIETRQDIARLKQISFSIGYQAGFEAGLQVDKYRSEIFEQMELYLQNKKKTATEKPTLEAMFADKNDLTKLVELLRKKGFVTKKELFWTRKPVEFAAMAKVCESLLQDEYKENGLQKHSAWTGYFKHKTREPIFSPQYFKATKNNEVYKHLYKFDFINEYFGIE